MKTQRCPNPFCNHVGEATIVKGLYACPAHVKKDYEPCRPYPASRDERKKR